MEKYNGLKDEDCLKSFWKGKNGIESQIRRDMGITYSKFRDKIRKTLEEIMECVRMGTPFDPRSLDNHGGNRQDTISIDSHGGAQIVADCIEQVLSIKNDWLMMNSHLDQSDLYQVSMSCVYNLLSRLKPKHERVEKGHKEVAMKMNFGQRLGACGPHNFLCGSVSST